MRTEAAVGGSWNAAGESANKKVSVKIKPCEKGKALAGQKTGATGATLSITTTSATGGSGGKAEATGTEASWWVVVSVQQSVGRCGG